MNRKASRGYLAFLAAFFTALSASAAPILDEGFDGFQTGARPAGWTFTNCNADSDAYTVAGYFGDASPSLALFNSDDQAVSCAFAPAGTEKLTFWARGHSVGCSATILVEEFFSSSWHTVTSFWNWPTGALLMGPYPLDPSTTQVRISNDVTAGSGFLIDDVRVGWKTPTPSPTPLSPSPTPSTTPTPIPTLTPVATPTPMTASYLLFSTYLGGDISDETGQGIDIASSGEIFVAGKTNSYSFPTCNAYQAAKAYDWDVFVTKFAVGGSRLAYSTYLGGEDIDAPCDLRVDSSGCAWLVGYTLSDYFPVRDAYQPTKGANWDAFFCRLGYSGSSLVNSSYLGSDGSDRGQSLRIASDGRVYLSGDTRSYNFPVLNAYQASLQGDAHDLFICSFSSATEMTFSTYWGGGDVDTSSPHTLVLLSGGGFAVAGSTLSADFPLLVPFQAELDGDADAFISAFASCTELIFSSYLGGGGYDAARGIAVDSAGAYYLSGATESFNFPTVNPYQAAMGGWNAGFLTKILSDGGVLAYSTYLGNYNAAAFSVEVDSIGAPYVAGMAGTNFPTKNAYDSSFTGGNWAAFAAKLAPDGSQLCFSTYLGNAVAAAYDSALSPSGELFLTGTTNGGFPVLNAYQPSNSGDYYEAFVLGMAYAPTPSATPPTPTPTPSPIPTLTPVATPSAFPTATPETASFLHYSTYLGGTNNDYLQGIEIGPGEDIFVAGKSYSSDFPIRNAYQTSRYSNYDAVVTRLASTGSRLIFSTYFGGERYDAAYDLRLDSLGNSWLTGETYSFNFPTRNPYQATKDSRVDYIAYFSQLDSSGSELLFSSYLGGYSGTIGYAIDIAPSGGICIAGNTWARDFPTRDAFQPTLGGEQDAFVCSFSSPTSLVFSTYLGGSIFEDVFPGTVACRSDGTVYVAGYTYSSDFPLVNPYQPSWAGSEDAFVVAFASATELLFSTFLGGEGKDMARGLAVAESGEIYLAGNTGGYAFPVCNAYQPVHAGSMDAFLTKLTSDGSALAYSTFFGSGNETAHAVKVDSSGSAYIAGEAAGGLPVKNSYQSAWAGNQDAFLSKFSPDGSQLCFSTYLGGNQHDYAYGIALSPSGAIHVAGSTASENFPVLNAYQNTLSSMNDGWAAGFGYIPTPSPLPGTPTPIPTVTAIPTTSPTPTATASPIHTPSPTPLPPDLALSATPVSGTAPLTVSFEATVTGGSGIQYYRWDYNGDGVWDYISAYASRSSHTYSQAGTYQAICEVEDSLGRVARNSVYDIRAFPSGQTLAVTASAEPDAGLAPLSTTLSGSVAAANPVLFYLWDFEYDGIVDSVSLTTPTVAHTYGKEGDFVARLSVIDSTGLMAADTVYLQVIPSFPPPAVTASADPGSGEVPLAVSFSGTVEPSGEIILYEWDFEGDGEYDWSSPTEASCSHTYPVVGTYEARLRATKTNGMSGQDIVSIVANAPSTLKVWISTPQEGWTVRGNAVTVRANTAPGYLTQWVRPQFKTETAVSWTDLTGSIYPPPHRFSCAWDTTAVADGAYHLRAAAADLSDGLVYSDAVSVIVNNAAAEPELDEGVDLSGNHDKKQKTDTDQTSLLEIAGGTSLKVLYGALEAETTVTLSTLAANPHPAPGVLFAFTSAAVETGGLGKPARLVIPYPDADGDGIVDGTGIGEQSLVILRYNASPGGWQETPECTVSAEEKLVQGWIMATGDYALGPTFLRADRPVLGSGDYDGDGTSDPAVFRPNGGVWTVRGLSRYYFGSSSDLPAPGDYDGDGTSDPAIFRPSSGLWAVRFATRFYFGGSSDLSVPADYDGDGRTDPAVFRAGASLWAVRGVTRAFFGSADDECSPGDYDGDGTEDIAVFRPAAGLWAVRNITRYFWGTASDESVSGDYSGDGAREGGIFRYSSGLWAIRSATRFYLGSISDFPLPADYDGDGRDSPAIFRATTGLWSVRDLTRAFFGTAGDLPVTR